MGIFLTVAGRIAIFSTSLLIVASLTIVGFIYLKLLSRWFGNNIKSITWLRENVWKVFFLGSVPHLYIFGPINEELIFRAPLIIAFSALSSFAWYGILASSVIFSFMHWRGNKIMPDIYEKKGAEGKEKKEEEEKEEEKEEESDDFLAEVERRYSYRILCY